MPTHGHAHTPVAQPQDTSYQQVIHHAVVAAGYLHDIGKINEQFQLKLIRSGKTPLGEFARHDLISCIIIFKILLSLRDRGMGEVDMLNHLSDPDRLAITFDGALTGPLFEKRPHDDEFKEMVILEYADEFPIMSAIMYLVGSHHKLPTGKTESGHYRATLQKHINASCDDEKQLKRNQRIAPSKYLFLTDPVADYAIALAKCFHQLHEVRVRHSHIDPETLMRLLSFYGRSALISADHVVSSQAAQYVDTGSSDDLYANSVIVDSKTKKKAYAQPLQQHLCLVAAQAETHFATMMSLLREEKLPTIAQEDLPPTLGPARLDPSNRFYWQDHMIHTLKAKHAEGILTSGFFGTLIAGTGSGKTRANAKMMASASGEVRYTLAVGLRTLTLQTQTEYLNDVGLEEKDVGMLIGSEISKRLYELNQAERKDGAATIGSTSGDGEDLHGTFTRPYDAQEMVDHELLKILKPKEQSMLLYPVVVCTVDHVIRVADMSRSHHVAASLRAMTADLVLDEVDSYSDIDLISIGKLVYRTGMGGRRVAISSATVNPDVVEVLYEAYRKGYEAYCQLMGKPCKIFTGWFSECAEINHVACPPDAVSYNALHAQFVAKLSKRLSMSDPRRLGAVLPIDHCTSPEEVMDDVLKACEGLHDQHHSVCPRTGVRLSCGVVRWNKVRHAITFTQHLLLAECPHIMRTLCYHSKQVAYVLDIHSEFLNELLSRKDDGAVAIFDHPMIQKAIAECQAKGLEDIMFIMSTTSIEEVGRDHDFDYAISEPSSYRSMIQLAGRVKRHRLMTCHFPNVLIMQKPIDRLAPRKGRGPRTPKGIKKLILNKMSDIDEGKRVSERPGEAWDAALAEDTSAFMSQDSLAVVDARTCLQGIANVRSGDPLSLYEFGKREVALKGSLSRVAEAMTTLLSLKKYLHDVGCYHTDFHYTNNPFRASQPSQLFYRNEEGYWMRVWENGKNVQPVAADRIVRPMRADDPYGRMAIQGGYEQRLDEIITKLRIEGDPEMKASLQSVSIIVNEESEANMVVEYHDALGMIKEL